MSSFTGTSFDDLILRDHLSSGVSADPAGLTGTLGDGSNVIDAGGGNDVVEAGDYGDVIAGGAGLDTIWGGLGTDFIDGGTGADRMFGGAGLDFYTVDSYHDVVFDDGTTPDDVADFIVTNLNYTLSEKALTAVIQKR
jgi:Ca2+-binding RTX toxin-like protein